MAPSFWTIGCIYGASSVMLGAFGAHGLKKRISDPSKLANWGTAAQYQVHTSLWPFLLSHLLNSFPRLPDSTHLATSPNNHLYPTQYRI